MKLSSVLVVAALAAGELATGYGSYTEVEYTEPDLSSELDAAPAEEEAEPTELEVKIAKFFGFDLEGDEGEKELLSRKVKTCASFRKCTKCVKNDTCNWCKATKTCHENSSPDAKCPTKKDYITSKWHCPDHLKWWGVLLIVLACVCCCPIISAVCFFFVIKRFCCGGGES